MKLAGCQSYFGLAHGLAREGQNGKSCRGRLIWRARKGRGLPHLKYDNHHGALPPTMTSSTNSSATDVEAGSENEAPHLSALFLIRFDQKVGYVTSR